MHPKLSKSYRRFYPFRLSVPSFIYPAGWVDNVRALGPFFDEIELLLLESGRESLPSTVQIHELADLAQTFELTYNIHLPTDILIGHSTSSMRRRAIDVLRRILDLVEPLRPSTCTLHLTPAADLKTIDQIVLWRDRLCEDLSGILSGGFSSKRLAVENLFYPFEWTEPVIDRLELCVCMDAGHLMVAGADPAVFFEKWERRIPIMHLHGVKGNQDHLGLDQLDSVRMEMMRRMLFRYHGTVSIEVFSFPALSLSLTALEKAWKTQTSET